MGFYSTKPAFRSALRPMARRAAIIHPDVWTWIAVVVAGVAGWLLLRAPLQPMLLWVVPLLLFLRLVLNVFDGVIAQETGQSSARGEAISEFADRIADVAVLGAVAASQLVWHRSWAVAAIITVLLVSYVGILGKAVGAGRQYGGLMGKPDRMVTIMIACAVHFGALRGWWRLPDLGAASATAFDWASLVVTALGLYTIGTRLRVILRTLGAAKTP